MTKRVQMRWTAQLGAAALALLVNGCGQAPSPPSAAITANAAARAAVTARAAGNADLGASALPGMARAPSALGSRHADLGNERASDAARNTADWIVDSDDSHGLPFVIVDKVDAKVFAFGADGRLRGASPALVGSAIGDDSVPGIGERPIADIRPEERTTPAGRFAAEMGHNANGVDIVWVDYDDAISMHRVRPTNPAERRLQRLASPIPSEHRISYGCINLPVAFYNEVVKPLFTPRNGIVYVLPETRSAQEVFGSYHDVAHAAR